MSLNAWFKSKTADKVLSPVRNQIIDLIENGSNVLEIGSGTGDLLIKASSKIGHGLGLDIDEGMVNFSIERCRDIDINNVEFKSKSLQSFNSSYLENFNSSTATLCLHEMSWEDAIGVLKLLGQYSTKIIIADFSGPKTVWGKISIEMDEIISGHYFRFRAYRKNGGIPQIAKAAGLSVEQEINTSIDGILVWVLNGRVTHNE